MPIPIVPMGVRPHERKYKSKATHVARARLVMKAKLWWTTGFPYRGRWVVVCLAPGPTSGPGSLERRDLREASYALKKLEGEFRRVLPHIVAEPHRWSVAIRRMLDVLKPWVHGSDAPPASLFEMDGLYSETVRRRARAVACKNPQLRAVLSAFSWIFVGDPASAKKHLRWIEDNAVALSVMLVGVGEERGLVVAAQLAHLAASVGRSLVAPMLALFGHPGSYDWAIAGGDEFVSQLGSALRSSKPHAFPEPPAPRLADAAVAISQRLVTADTKAQRRFLTLLQLIELPAVVSAWARWWPDAVEVSRKGRNIQRSFLPGSKRAERCAELTPRLDYLRCTEPAALKLDGVIDALWLFSGNCAPGWFGNACNALHAVNGATAPSLRASFVVHWAKRADRAEPAELRRWPTLLGAFARYAAGGGDLSPWRGPVLRQGQTNSFQWNIDDNILDSDGGSAAISRAFAALALFGRNYPDTSLDDVGDQLVDLVEVCSDVDRVVALTHRMVGAKEHDNWHPTERLKCTLAVTKKRPDLFCEVLRAFERLESSSGLDADDIYKPLARAFVGFEHLLLVLLTGDESARLVSCSRKLAALAATKQPFELVRRMPAGGATWIEDYPAPLHPALRQLAEVSDRAEYVARRASKGVVPNPAALRREHEALTARLATATGEARRRMQQRLANLDARLCGDFDIRAAKLARLAAKLEQAAARELLRAADSRLLVALGAACQSLVGTEQWPAWLSRDENLALLPAIFELPPRHQKLARRLLRLRCGPPPWDLRDAPANARFVASMRARGIDCRPWIDGMAPRYHDTSHGQIVLALEDDPLEVFRMGAHFQTCLSPNQINYFSVFANAADINKRVLYARNERGRVVGRRLLCLSGDGTIVAFSSYCHDIKYGFDECSAAFARALANAMGTAIVSRGVVPTLVAADWYDDGAVDISRRLDFLRTDSAFVRALPTIDPGTLVDELHRLCDGLRLEERVVPQLMAMPELTVRPELVAAIAAAVDLQRVAPATCVTIATVLERADCLVSEAILCAKAAELVYEYERQYGTWHAAAAGFLARQRPSRALLALRQTRVHGVRRWCDEYDVARLESAATALLRLNRPHQARKLFAKIARTSTCAQQRRTAAAKARRL